MSHSIKEPEELRSIYERRFDRQTTYRKHLWDTLIRSYFQKIIPTTAIVMDLGCGYGEFINHINCARKIGMDLNPRSRQQLNPDVELIEQDCSARWPLPDACLDIVFTSNFFEHLPDKLALRDTLREAARCLRPGGRIIALGPNIKFVQGAYWDFWDHFLCLTELSLGEALENNGFRMVRSIPRFLPYTTVNAPEYPMAFVKLYLALPLFWRFFGQQFLIVAERS
jgi:SAM-dependent methyltransferase